MASQSAKISRVGANPIFHAITPTSIIECVRDPQRAGRLFLHISNGRSYSTRPTIVNGGRTFKPASITSGFAQNVRFPVASKPFGSAPSKLTASMLEFLGHYAHLQPDAAALVVGFAFASWFVDCVPVAPLLYLTGPDNEAILLLRLMACFCRRPVLLGHIEMGALNTLPANLDPTLLCSQRNLAPRVMEVLLASNTPHFTIARGKGELYAYGAKAFLVDPDYETESGVRVSLSPAQSSLPALAEADEKAYVEDFQAKLLRYRLLNYQRVREIIVNTKDFVPAMRDEVQTWLAPICDCPDLQELVRRYLLQLNRENASNWLVDARSIVAEAALFLCHKKDVESFFVGDLADCVNALLKGRHEDRELTAKKVGLQLRSLGISGVRVVEGYKIVLSENVRAQIHRIASAHQVPAARDGVKRCNHCLLAK